MNKVILMGRLTRDPEVRYSQGENRMAVARYTLAVDRRARRDGEQAFGKAGEWAEKWLRKGIKIAITGRIQTGSYIDRETGKKVYTTDIVIEEQEFAESRAASEGNSQNQQRQQEQSAGDGFMNIPDGIDEELPFN